ncbi:16S rRNA methyltransferase [Candidatus Bathyarchaeota archaeon]|nr:16S rRNA methyltransferase [Candidatus Bathyarchaeota archaeon]
MEIGFPYSFEGLSLLILILAESALETIPKNLWKHPAVKRHSKKRKKHPKFLLLDRSYHHAAMKTLPNNQKRGRPDIVHFALLEALGSPLNKERLLQAYVHTINDHVIEVKPETRLPRNYNRFLGLMEHLFELGRTPPNGKALLKLEAKTLPQLLREVSPTQVVAFSTAGKPRTLEDVVSELSSVERPAVIIGGFPHGHFSASTIRLADELVCIDEETLETWTVTSRVVYEYERAAFLPLKRLKR